MEGVSLEEWLAMHGPTSLEQLVPFFERFAISFGWIWSAAFSPEAKVDLPYAAHVYSFGVSEDTGLFWVATELVHGITLGQWLAKHGPMPPDQFVPFFECVAQAVQAAHDHGIVHRALKPSKVMVLGSAGRSSPKLLCFALDQLTSSDAGTGSQAADLRRSSGTTGVGCTLV